MIENYFFSGESPKSEYIEGKINAVKQRLSVMSIKSHYFQRLKPS
jgi:hypothetical protein